MRLRRERCRGTHVKPAGTLAWIGGAPTPRFNYLVEAMHASGPAFRKPGQGLTRPHGLKFGTNVRRGAMTNGWVDMKIPT